MADLGGMLQWKLGDVETFNVGASADGIPFIQAWDEDVHGPLPSQEMLDQWFAEYEARPLPRDLAAELATATKRLAAFERAVISKQGKISKKDVDDEEAAG